MFTGIVQDVGEIYNMQPREGDVRLQIKSRQLDLSDVRLGDSIAVNGVCLTVVELPGNGFAADVSRETIDLTSLATLGKGARVNLEKALTPTTRLGGHLVGQTNYPECVLARELAICYATLGVVSNYAAGMQNDLTVDEVMDNLKSVETQIADLFEEATTQILNAQEPYDCSCNHALDHAFI